MAISELFRKKSVQDSMEIGPGIILNIYGSNHQETSKLLETYAGKDLAQKWQLDQSFKQEEQLGEKRGLSFHYRGQAAETRNPQGRRLVHININLAELPGFEGKPSDNEMSKMREEFKETLQKVMLKVSTLEEQLKQRELETRHLKGNKPLEESTFPLTSLNKLGSSPNGNSNFRFSESASKQTLIEAVMKAQEKFGKDVVFVNANWQNHKGEIIQSSDRILRAAQAAEKSMKNAGLSTSYSVRDPGIVRNLHTNRDEYFLYSPASAKSDLTPEKLRVALQKHFDDTKAGSSLQPNLSESKNPVIGVQV